MLTMLDCVWHTINTVPNVPPYHQPSRFLATQLDSFFLPWTLSNLCNGTFLEVNPTNPCVHSTGRSPDTKFFAVHPVPTLTLLLRLELLNFCRSFQHVQSTAY